MHKGETCSGHTEWQLSEGSFRQEQLQKLGTNKNKRGTTWYLRDLGDSQGRQDSRATIPERREPWRNERSVLLR